MKLRRPLFPAALLWMAVICLLSAAGISLQKMTPGEVLLAEGAVNAELQGYLRAQSRTSGGSWQVQADDTYMRPVGSEEIFRLGSVIWYAEEKIAAEPGALLTFSAMLSLPEPPDNPGQFDQPAYLASRGITATAEKVFLSSVSAGKIRLLAVWAEKLRTRLTEGLASVYEGDGFALLAALLLGDKSYLESETEALYEAAGLTHIFSVSGLHVSLIALFINRSIAFLLSFIPWERLDRKKRPGYLRQKGYPLCCVILTAAALILYRETAGRGLSLSRAAYMYLLGLGAVPIGRSYDRLSAWSAAALAVLIPHPAALFQASFVLSFGCTLLLILLYPFLCRETEAESDAQKAVLLPLVLLLGITPQELAFFYTLHPYTIAGSLLVLPLMPWLLGGGLLSGMLALLWAPAGLVIAGATEALIRLFAAYCRLIKRLPGHTLILGAPAVWQVVLYYPAAALGVLWILRRKNRRRRRREIRRKTALSAEKISGGLLKRRRLRRLLAGEWEGFGRSAAELMLLTMLLPGIFLLRPLPKLSLTSLYVGQGDCHVIRTADGHAMLVDSGRSYLSPASKYVLPYLKYSGISRLDLILVSHTDSDHTNALAELMRADGIRTGGLILPETAQAAGEAEELKAAAAERNIPIYFAAGGTAWTLGNTECLLLYPPPEQRNLSAGADGANSRSLVLQLRCGDFTALYTGDLDEAGEAFLTAYCAEQIRDTDYLKVAHHGSKTSSGEAFLRLASPQIAVISCGRNNSYGHPAPEVLSRFSEIGAQLCRTDQDGAVTCILKDNGEQEIRTFRKVKLPRNGKP